MEAFRDAVVAVITNSLSPLTTRAAFLFGSGISRDSGAPNLADLTDSILSDPWVADRYHRFHPAEKTSDELTSRVQEFLVRIRSVISPRLDRAGKICSYEDLYSAARQIQQDEQEAIVNPLIADFVANLKSRCADLSAHHAPDWFATLATDAQKLIQWVVFHRLERVALPQKLDAISGVAAEVDQLDIFSLNHDVLIEEQFRQPE